MARKKHSKKNYLLTALRVQEIYLKHKYKNDVDTGLSNRHIFQNYIYPIYPMTERTLYNFLDLSPKVELKKIESIENASLKLEL